MERRKCEHCGSYLDEYEMVTDAVISYSYDYDTESLSASQIDIEGPKCGCCFHPLSIKVSNDINILTDEEIDKIKKQPVYVVDGMYYYSDPIEVDNTCTRVFGSIAGAKEYASRQFGMHNDCLCGNVIIINDDDGCPTYTKQDDETGDRLVVSVKKMDILK